jgi:hypothetical protein
MAQIEKRMMKRKIRLMPDQNIEILLEEALNIFCFQRFRGI